MIATEENTGSLSVLNCNAGDIEIRFDNASEADTERACQMITDMLARGYIIAVKDESGEWKRVKWFDPKEQVYVVQETPKPPSLAPTVTEGQQAPTVAPRGKRGRPRKLPIKGTKAVGVAPTAGG